MYIPASFAVTDRNKLHDFIEQYSFGLLISQIDGLPVASHIPFLLERENGPHGSLVGHIARANPQAKYLKGPTALAIFNGPHAYISPTWYEAEQVVPTWNYVAVHAYGSIEPIDDEAGLLAILQRTVETFERNMPRPWSFDESSPYGHRLLDQIIGFRIPIEKLEGKWKLNQNHPPERRRKVVAALRDQPGENAAAIADLME